MSGFFQLVKDTYGICRQFQNWFQIMKQTNKNFYRMERLEAQTGNDSMKFNYNGISQFSSIQIMLQAQH